MENPIREDRDQVFEESLEKIFDLLKEKKYFLARDEILKYNAADIAEMLEEISDENGIRMAVILFRLLPKDTSVDVFSYMSTDDQVDIISEITEKETSSIVEELDFDDKIDILEELPANIVNRILEKTPKNERKQINTFLNYPENSAGSLMTPEFVSLKKDWTVVEALEHIRDVGMEAETVYTLYVRDNSYKLIGIVSLSKLVVSSKDTRMGDIMKTDFVYETVTTDQEEVSEDFKKYDLIAIPVVDKEQRLVGIITVDDILDVIEDEATEDIERMAGVIDMNKTDKKYLDISVWKHTLNRLPWLVILMIAYIFTGLLVKSFDAKLEEMIILVTYMPLVMGTSGNTGSQSATLVIRGFSTGDLETDDWYRILWKEVRVGVLVGLILGGFNFLRIYFLDREPWTLALTVSLAMGIIVILSKVVGSMIPVLVRKMKQDPALIANPLMDCISDALALSVYFLLALKLLHL
ncbi:MAG: magnesium transporter [Eubacteriales bacterium]|nr:magnesium transporter [Eubacteriales bacterium]